MSLAVKLRSSLLGLALSLQLSSGVCADSSVAKVQLGTVDIVGLDEEGVNAYLGIPYAEQPVGDNRWRAPQAVRYSAGKLDARRVGAACPQPTDSYSGMTTARQDEACLFLNIWTPQQRASKPLPVMVWLHGGAHRIGSGGLPPYNGASLARRGVVVVTLNYRLGYLGYFSHPALEAGANFGLLDQLEALKWLREHIAAFQGDPNQITVFGESAGALDTLYLMASPLAKGLFQAAIVQSGGGWTKPATEPELRKKILKKLATAGIEGDVGIEQLRALPAQRLVEIQNASGRKLGFGPFIDQHTVQEPLYKVFETGRQMPIPLVIGSNSWEASVVQRAGVGAFGEVLARLPPVMYWYRNRVDNTQQRKDQLFDDIAFGAPSRWIANRHSQIAPAWLYYFDYVRSAKRNEFPGARHGGEIKYVFDARAFLDKLPGGVTANDKQRAVDLADCWASFAKYLQPQCKWEWSPYRAGQDQILLIADEVATTPHPHAKILEKIERWFKPE